jgi:dTDP-4-dehydrorhamnose reductase
VTATLALADAARAAGATFVFLSSEYVFDGEDGPYDEGREVNPINEYGRQKVEVERALADAGDDWIVARVSCVYGREARRKNFVYQLLDASSAGRELKVPADQVGTPTAAANAAAVIRELWSAGERGVFHVAGADRLLRSDFGVIVAEELGLDPALVRPTPTSELGLAAPRPLGAGLLTDRAASRARTPIAGVREGIRALVAEAPLEAASPA